LMTEKNIAALINSFVDVLTHLASQHEVDQNKEVAS